MGDKGNRSIELAIDKLKYLKEKPEKIFLLHLFGLIIRFYERSVKKCEF